MISVFTPAPGGIIQGRILSPGEDIPLDAVWIDMQSPEPAERQLVEEQLGVELPGQNDVWKNHVLNRLYMDDDLAYMIAAVITKVESPYPGTAPVAFILGPKFFITLHEIAPTSFKNFASRIAKPFAVPQPVSPAHLMEGLVEEMITRVAYNSQIVVDTLDSLSHSIFDAEVLNTKGISTSQLMKTVLKRLGAAADLNSKINESLHSINRLLHFFKKARANDAALDSKIDILVMDTVALTTQTAFLSDKITLQLDATLGMINVEQNLIIKIFSVVSVFLMPPTLISSLYGMNFEFMPELSWTYGYPFAIGLMVLFSVIPYIYFRRKGWL